MGSSCDVAVILACGGNDAALYLPYPTVLQYPTVRPTGREHSGGDCSHGVLSVKPSCRVLQKNAIIKQLHARGIETHDHVYI